MILPPTATLFFVKNKNFYSAIAGKIVVDAGSGNGELIPAISMCNPKKIISVDVDENGLLCQQELIKNKLPVYKKYIDNIEFYHTDIEKFITKNINFDTILFSESLCLMPANKILSLVQDKNILIIQGNVSKTTRKIRKVLDTDYINMLKELNFSHITQENYYSAEHDVTQYIISANYTS